MKKYKLLAYSNPIITIDECVKEEIMKLMNWSEEDFAKHTKEVNDDLLLGENDG